MRLHHLKTWLEPFEAVVSCVKTFEVRHDDRGFAVGDELLLQEWDPSPRRDLYSSRPLGHTGREHRVRVTYILHSRYGLPPGLCVMGIEPVPGAT